MSPTEIIERATGGGVLLALLPSGNISMKGEQAAIDRWLPEIRQHKSGIVALLRLSGGAQASFDRRVTSGSRDRAGAEAVQPIYGDREEFGERAALVEYGARVPREWAEGFARLDCTKPPAGMALGRWKQILNDGGLFLDQWAHKAAALGWSVVDVVGVDPDAPTARYDNMGLVPMIGGHRVVAINADGARLEIGPGRFQTHRRRLNPGAVALWELAQ